MPSVSAPFVSVVIPVYNDAVRLVRCLSALQGQTYPRKQYEVIVVDNGSEENIGVAAGPFEGIRVLKEGEPGSYAARNKGITCARGDVIALTDADCIPDADWIEKGVAGLKQVPECGFVAGHIEVACQDPERPSMAELYEVAAGFDQEYATRVRRFGFTANLFVHRQRFEDVGLFDAGLKSGGDHEWGNRVDAMGYTQQYVPEARVVHPARASIAEITQKTRRIIGGHYDRERPTLPVLFKKVVRDLIPPFKYCTRIFSSGKIKGRKHKVQYFLLMTWLKWVMVLERIRLYLGGTSRRS